MIQGLKKYWIVLLVIVGLLVVFVLDSNGLREELKLSKQENKEYQEKIDSLKKEYKYLSKTKQKEIIKYVKIKELIKQKEDEKDSTINNVYSLDEQQLDSTIRAYKHPKRN